MRCPSCGTLHDARNECAECALPSEVTELDSYDETTRKLELPTPTRTKKRSNSRLIEFPGAGKSVPVWRKEIAERVREAQERKAREAAAEDQRQTGQTATAPQLELIPQAEAAPINPLVAAALKRIERAHLDVAQPVQNSTRPMAAVAYATSYEPVVEPSPPPVVFAESPTAQIDREEEVEEPEVTRTNLVVLSSPTSAIVEVEPEEEIVQPALEPKTQVITRHETTRRRIITDDVNNPALNYLDSIATSVRVEHRTGSAGPVRRIVAAVFDLLILALMFSPFAAGLELAQGNWRNLQVMTIALSAFLVIGFVYLTISTALTGRTLGMRLAGLRIVDVRTGLIPTGSQSASRSLLYLFSLFSAGLLFLGVLFDSDRRTPHERFSSTAVVKA